MHQNKAKCVYGTRLKYLNIFELRIGHKYCSVKVYAPKRYLLRLTLLGLIVKQVFSELGPDIL